MAIDLTGLRGVVESWMDGSTVKVVAASTAADGELDTETNRIQRREPVAVYEQAGLITPLASGAARNAPDLAVAVVPNDPATTHRMLLPLSFHEHLQPGQKLQVGQRVTQTTVDPLMGDPAIADSTFRITEIPGSSAIAVVRIVFLKEA